MYSDVSIEQRAHDLALQATILQYQQKGIIIDEKNAFEYVIAYRRILPEVRRSLQEGQTDLP